MSNETNELGKRKTLNDVLADPTFKCRKKYAHGDDGTTNWYHHETVVSIEPKNYTCLGDTLAAGSRSYKDPEEHSAFKKDRIIICSMEIKSVACLLVDEHTEERRKLSV